jgi:hypothetical protein
MTGADVNGPIQNISTGIAKHAGLIEIRLDMAAPLDLNVRLGHGRTSELDRASADYGSRDFQSRALSGDGK